MPFYVIEICITFDLRGHHCFRQCFSYPCELIICPYRSPGVSFVHRGITMCGANLSYYEICERNVKVWIPFIPWDSQLCMLWLTQTKKITDLKLFDMCMWTKLWTKTTNTILNKIKNFPTYLMGFFGAWTPNKNIFKTGLIYEWSDNMIDQTENKVRSILGYNRNCQYFNRDNC